MSRPQRERVAILQAISSDLYWLHAPLRRACTRCGGEGRVGVREQRTACSTCKGVGSLAPRPGALSPLSAASVMLHDVELQALVARRRKPEGLAPVSDGECLHGDPTGNAAVRSGSVEMRADKITASWRAGVAGACRDIAAAWCMVDGTAVRVHDVHAVQDSISEMLRSPALRLERWIGLADNPAIEVFDARIIAAASSVRSVRSGSGGRVPSVSAVIAQGQAATAAEPKPVQRRIEGCVSCARWVDERGAQRVEPVCDRWRSQQLCRMCGDYRSGHGVWPPVAAIGWVHRHGGRLTEHVLMRVARTKTVGSWA